MSVASELFVKLAADIVSAYVINNTVSAAALPALITEVHDALLRTSLTSCVINVASEVQKPAVPIKKSVTPDFIICLENGKAFKSLKRHLRASYGMTADDYRSKWGLPDDYPMVAPNYAEKRSNMAKQIGLGRIRRRAAS